MALAVNLDYMTVDQRLTFQKGDPVVGTAVLVPCRFNTWVLVSSDEKDWSGREVRYGDSLCIQLSGNKGPFYIEAPMPEPSIATGNCGFVLPRLVPWKSLDARYGILYQVLCNVFDFLLVRFSIVN